MTGKRYGYCRVSSEDQNLDAQREALEKAGCDVILEEKVSGATVEARAELQLLLRVLGKGDVLTVTKLDRLARNTIDMLEIAAEIDGKGAGLKSLAEPWCDTTSPAGRLIFTVFAGVAQFERERIKERQREGIERAKRDGVYKGRKPTVPRDKVMALRAEGKGPAEIARTLQIGESSVFRVLREAADGHEVPSLCSTAPARPTGDLQRARRAG
jgi:DNA invertase Pin-like site-specific DNA recombinase